MKCNTCKVALAVKESTDYACCMWYMDNVVCGDKTVDECPVYDPLQREE